MEVIEYKCCRCGKHFYLLDKEVKHSIEEERYITCPYNGQHKDLIVIGKYDNIEEVMNDKNIYVRECGRIRQIK